jgi:hypothetical protein
MTVKRRVHGGILAAIGFLLSPLSWWNDLFINVPLALAFAWGVSCFHAPAFGVSFVVGYWLTNVLGLIFMHKGAARLVTGQAEPYTWKKFLRDLTVSLGYTALIVLLVRLDLIKPLTEYLPSK